MQMREGNARLCCNNFSSEAKFHKVAVTGLVRGIAVRKGKAI